MSQHPRLLAISNGHGEDDIAVKVLAALAPMVPGLEISAWPMVGAGAAYRALGVPITGPGNHLPGEGFGTLGLGLFLRDLRHGFIGTHWRQFRHARALRGCHDLLLGVGDVIPLLAGTLSQTPMAFVACAKSAYYGPPDGHTALERRLMRRNCIAVFPRDALSARGLAAKGVSCCYLGNPMMDGLGPADDIWPLQPDQTGVLMLAGSRRDAPENMALLLAAAAGLAENAPSPARLRFLFALHPSLSGAALSSQPGWEPVGDTGQAVILRHATGAEAVLATGRIGAMARAARLAVGLAGTANEQAIGLGLPLITLPGAGNQGEAYVRMKAAFFGPAAIAVSRDACALADAMRALLDDPERQARMAQAGRERMGDPGASEAIAARIAARLTGIPAGSEGH